ncbi:hypothetical protein [Pseudoalteromonas luteoviolacea]|uniref:Uncharacterized protein n=1 Tax=Pseudoalteromonas luteoviolacea (strain 2ta16) TaxID=1353533 RepID=V4H874_PSEL2|nr:hypothetical protein [Pseudoalteromonas luteoviolacea]ESP93686.1 hypothetical protein PL2TA16_02890 [Pseudoalteromonas luteoviolacea 2ta16]KZN41196.1 hypothetical protein N483_16425 [Pseudoalteromonas luteoviolacea NCIMB 1944]
MKTNQFNDKTMLVAWLFTLLCWGNTALVMVFSPFVVLEVTALCFAIVATQITFYVTKRVAEQNPLVASVYKNLFGDC